MSRIILHIDLNAFFVTCEVLSDPTLAGKPLIVGHEGRSGIVSTCSYEARAYGIHSGMPTFQAQKLCPGVLIIQPHFRLYEVMSRSFFAYIKEYSSIIEQASVDECYVDMSKVLSKEKDPVNYLRALQFRLKKETGLSCSIGVSSTKWLAKMASDMQKPMGLVFIKKEDIPKILYPMPIESFWGIGKKTAPRLKERGILTIGDFAKKLFEEEDAMRRELGKFYETCLAWISGESSDEIVTEPDDPKSVGVSETLMRDCQGFDEIESTLKRVCAEVSRRAKKEKKQGKGISLQVKDTSFSLHSKRASFERSTNDAAVLFEMAKRLYQQHFENMEVRLVGVTLEKLVDPSKEQVQMTLWDYERFEQEDQTQLLISEINRKLGKPVVTRGSNLKKGRKKQ